MGIAKRIMLGLGTFFLLMSILAGCGEEKKDEEAADRMKQEAAEKTSIGCRVEEDYYIPQAQKLIIPASQKNSVAGWVLGSVAAGNDLYYVFQPLNGLDMSLKVYRVPLQEIFLDHVLSGAYPAVGAEEVTKSVSVPESLSVYPGQGAGDREYIQRFFAGEEGQLYFLCSLSGRPQEDNYYRLYRCDAEGNVMEDLTVTEALPGFKLEQMITEEYLNRHPSAVDKKGNLFITDVEEHRMWVLNGQGELLCTIDFSGYELEDLAAVSDGNVYGVAKTENGSVIVRVDTEAAELIEMLTLPESKGNGFLLADYGEGRKQTGSNQDCLLFYSDGTRLYACDLSAKAVEELFLWADMEVDGKGIQTKSFVDFERKASVSSDSDSVNIFVLDADYNLTLIAKVPAEDIPEDREKLVLGVLVADDALKEKVEEFNRRSFYYEIEIREYGVDNGSQRIETEIMTGKGPDLFPTSAIDVPKFLKKGLLEDLAPFLEDGQGLEREDLVESVLRCNTLNGVLVCVPASFSLDILAGRASQLPDSRSWTIEEYMDYIDSHRGAEVVGGAYYSEREADSRVFIVLLALYGNMDHFVDWEKGEAYFDTQEFLDIVKFAGDYHVEGGPTLGQDILARMREGSVLLNNRNISTMKDYLIYVSVLEGDAGFIGYPAEEGVPCYGIYDWDAYCIRSGSPGKNGAWAFIEFMLTSRRETGGRDSELTQNFPAIAGTMDYVLEKSMVKEYQKDETWNFLLDADGNPIELPKWTQEASGESYGIYAATEEDVAAFRELVDQAVFSNNLKSATIYGIVEEELIYYMEGQKTAEDTVEVIQNRVQLFLDEM